MSTSNGGTLLRVENLNTGYGNRQVLSEVSLEIQSGEMVLLIGGNGSGKSTLLKAVYGLLRDYRNRKGRIFFCGEDITNDKPSQMIQKGVVYVPQKNNTFQQLSLAENLELAASELSGSVERERRINDVFEKLPQLTHLKERKPFHLSGGERQQLALGMALVHSPKMILLDEPNLGLAPRIWQQNWEIIKDLNKQGIAFLLVEHWFNAIRPAANRVYRMRLGRIQDVTLEV